LAWAIPPARATAEIAATPNAPWRSLFVILFLPIIGFYFLALSPNKDGSY
jgi:hypothetical protein